MSLKKITSTSGLGAAGRSIVTVGLDLVEQRHGSLAGKRALLIGTGSFARVAVAALARYKCGEIAVFSSSGRARVKLHLILDTSVSVDP